MVRMISTFELRDKLADYLDSIVAADTSLIVSRFNKPLVIISPYKATNVVDPADYFGFLGGDTDGEKFLEKIRRSKKEAELVKNLRKGNG